jgi:hypothetical protein
LLVFAFSINFANERLQGFFNEHIIKSEQEEYMREGIFWKPLKVPDNSEIIHLIDNGSNGIYKILDSTCLMPRGTAAIFTRELFSSHKKHSKIKTARAPSRPEKGQKVIQHHTLVCFHRLISIRATDTKRTSRFHDQWLVTHTHTHTHASRCTRQSGPMIKEQTGAYSH